jgi:MFS transporter, DHA1 family, inner membrane transport protein
MAAKMDRRTPPKAAKLLNDPRTESSRLAWQIVAASGCRLVLNTARRFAYPFAPALSRGLQVPLTTVTAIIAITQAAAFLGLFGGPLTDRFGYRRMMLVGLGLMAGGMLAVGVYPLYPVVLVGLFLAGMGKSIYDPAIYGYTGMRVPFSQRGRVTGFLEFSWAASALVGMPLVGLLIEHQDWRAPFWWLGGLGLVFMVLTVRLIPRDIALPKDHDRPGLGTAWRQLLKEPAALGLLGFTFWNSLGNDQLFVVYGAWMEKSFGLGVGMLGLTTVVIGVAELAGEGLIVLLSDRIGLKRSAVIGSVLAAASYFLLPLVSRDLTTALVGLFLIFVTFEFSMVSGISLSTEALPEYRATMMAAFYAAAGLGRLTGALIGGAVWLYGGMTAVGVISALATLASLASLTAGLSYRRRSRT